MTLDDKFNKLLTKVNEMTLAVQNLRHENDKFRRETESLHTENDNLRNELASLRGEYHKLKLEAADRTELVQSKLSGVLQRLEELERLEG